MEKLVGLNVLVTRPTPQGILLCDQIRAHMGNATHFPTVEIADVNDVAALNKQLETIDQLDWLVFISPQSVLRSAARIHQVWPRLPDNVMVAAVGAGTAAALKEYDFTVHAYPAYEWSSEGLLRLPHFSAIRGKHIGLVKGDSGRDLLESEFTARGAEVSHFVVYRRCLPLQKNPSVLFDHAINVMVCTSGEGLRNLVKLIDDPHLQHIPLVVVSERMVSIASELNFDTVLLADNASHEAILRVLGEYNVRRQQGN